MDKTTNFANSANNLEPKRVDDFAEQFKYVQDICSDISKLFERLKRVDGVYDSTVEKQHQLSTLIPKQIGEGVTKIAVVGAIKSGKSTFINSLLQDDILKRGAGVVTSTITRIKKGETLKAQLNFKSWDQINCEIEKALTLIPMAYSDSANKKNRKPFDLRRKDDRNFLKQVKLSLCSENWYRSTDTLFDNTNQNLSSETGLRAEAILISNAVDSYDYVKDFVQNEPSYVEFTGNDFYNHKQFTGVSSNAIFVKDVTLQIPSTLQSNYSLLDNCVEIADCQGVDSTDTSHIAHIQDYLLLANMVIYVISSRTGLREADIKFLNIIKKIATLNNIIFILNADFNEHESLESLIKIENSVKQGLSYFVENPQIYTISSLFNLLSHIEPKALNSKELAILKIWQQETSLVDYSHKMAEEFDNILKKRVQTEQFLTIFQSHVERLNLLLKGLKQRNLIFMELLSDNLKMVSDAAQKLQQLQDSALKFESSLDDLIATTTQSIKSEIKSAIKLFFNKKEGRQALSVKEFILGAKIYDDNYENMLSNFGFNHALYCMFQDFRNRLDSFMTQEFNPSVVEFIQGQELCIKNGFESLYQSCSFEPSAIYQFSTSKSLNLKGLNGTKKIAVDIVDLNGAKRILGLSLPKSEFATAYSSKIRADAIARFSFYSIMEIIAKFIKSVDKSHKSSRALNESAKKIKKEALRSVMLHFDSYLNHLQDDYLFKLVDAVARDSKDKLMESFRLCAIESQKVEELISGECMDKSEQFEILKSISLEIDNLLDRIFAIDKTR
ncbi:MAG: dynamin family protein [Desulfamplus sp.]|nr:dynamin family protein [Desulfamplus sp.]MBF0390116.1 dynamin family protein [Desulfamplus sp.]